MKTEHDTLISLKYGQVSTSHTYIDTLPQPIQEALKPFWPFTSATDIEACIRAYEYNTPYPTSLHPFINFGKINSRKK